MKILRSVFIFVAASAIIFRLSEAIWAQAVYQQDVDRLLQSIQGPKLQAGEALRHTLEDGYLRSLGAPPSCFFPIARVVKGDMAATAQSFLLENRAAFGARSESVGFQTLKTSAKDSRGYVRLRQTWREIPVFGAEVVVQLNAASSKDINAKVGVTSVFNGILKNTSDLDSGKLTIKPTNTTGQAQQAAMRYLAAKGRGKRHTTTTPVLMIFAPQIVDADGPLKLVWQMEVSALDNPLVKQFVLIDAHSGDVVFHYNLVHEAKNREIWDANNVKGSGGSLQRSEGGAPSGITDVNNAYDNYGATYDFYMNHHGRDSIDNAGMKIIGTTRYCPPDPPNPPGGTSVCPMRNAFWNGAQMYFGDGYALDDVVGHELTHGVTQYESNLVYANQPGAINESFSDIWGEFIDQETPTGNDSPAVKWLMGEDLPAGAIRSMKDPTLYNDPDRMSSPLFRPYTPTPDDSNDNGGVHTNSGVGNKLAYLLAEGDTFNGFTVSGKGNNQVAALFYEVQTNLLVSTAKYEDLGIQLKQAAVNLGWSAGDRANLQNALCGVEITSKAAAPTFSPSAGTFITCSQAVILSSTTSGATIYYTTNGTDPTTGSPSVPSGGSITIDHSLTVKAMAVAPDFCPSDISSASYTIVYPNTLTACLFDDSNANGTKDGGEDGSFVGWSFDWSGPSNTGTGSITSGGCIQLFNNKTPGSYSVTLNVSDSGGKFSDPTGSGKRWKLTTPKTVVVSVGCPDDAQVQFGVVQLGKITAHKWDDTDMNASQNGGEANVNGWPFRLTGVDITGANVDLSGITNVTGDYVFADLMPSSPAGYKVEENLSFTDCKTSFDGKRWQQTTAKEATVNLTEGLETTRAFGNVRLGSITVRKFDDGNMNGVRDGGEPFMAGWPIRIDGPTPSIPCPPTWPKTGDTEIKFDDLLPGSYTIEENLPWDTVRPCATDTYTVQRVDFDGKRWQATTPTSMTFNLPEAAAITRDFGNVCLGQMTACVYNDKNMSGNRQSDPESYTDTNGNGMWDPAELYADVNHNGNWDPAEPYTDSNGNGRYDSGEPFVDLNGNNCWDPAEPLRDTNGNGVWDPAEPFEDTFANGVRDDAEEGLSGWPVGICGQSLDGRCVGPFMLNTGETGAVEIAAIPDLPGGCATFKDLPPGNYMFFEDVEWCGAKVDWCNGGVAPPKEKCKTTFNGRRWLATTPAMQSFTFPECGDLPAIEFGNVELGSIVGTLNRQDCPNDPLTALSGWNVCMTEARVEPVVTFMTLPLPPTDPDCVDLPGSCATTASDGSFRFGELVPGVYMVKANMAPGYVPVGDVVELSVPFRVVSEDIQRNLLVRNVSAVCPVYQAVPGDSEGLNPCAGYIMLDTDPVTVAPGIFSFDPGNKWENFVRAYRAGVPYCLKDVVLEKVHPGGRQCVDMFPPGRIIQHGTPNVRTWWPLMYEPGGTNWALSVTYTTYVPMQLPGETEASVVHQDVWKWKVDVTLDSLDNLLDLFHSLPFGTSQTPLISDEVGYENLKSIVAAAKAALDPEQASQALTAMELSLADLCISAMPNLPYPRGDGRGLGVANTTENPACCKIFTDLDYLLFKYGAP